MQKNFFTRYVPVLLLLLLFISCKDVFTKGNFTVTGPAAWLRKDSVSKDGCKKVQFFKLTGDTAAIWHENISIAVVHSKKFTTYASSVLALTKEDAVFFEEKEKGDTVINGYETSWAQITVLHQKAADDEKKEQKIYFVKGEAGNIYMIICTAHKDGISSIQNSIDKVLQSFKVINEGRKPNK